MTTAVKERPILFSGSMVRAILEGRKTQTRRVLKAKDADPDRCITLPTLLKNVAEWREQDGRWFGLDGWDTLVYADCPYGSIGDRLWVRERWRPTIDNKSFACIQYSDESIRLQLNDNGGEGDPIGTREHKRPMERVGKDGPSWKPSIHMPRWASRITLEITGVRVERLCDISEEDAIAEGSQCAGVPASLTNRGAFAKLWESINGGDSLNPFVWVLEFRVTK